MVLSECASVHVTDARDVGRTFFSNFNHVVLSGPPNVRLQPRRLTIAAGDVSCKPRLAGTETPSAILVIDTARLSRDAFATRACRR
jgi:hypothetical protein